MFHGNNGFGDNSGKRQATAILGELREQGEPVELMASAVLAAGLSARAVFPLQRLMARAD